MGLVRGSLNQRFRDELPAALLFLIVSSGVRKSAPDVMSVLGLRSPTALQNRPCRLEYQNSTEDHEDPSPSAP